MRVSSYSDSSAPAASRRLPIHEDGVSSPFPAFSSFGEEAFAQARRRNVPLFLVIGDLPMGLDDPSVALHLSERTVPVHLPCGMRPDVELLCQRAGMLFSGEGALPLCALLHPDGLPFLAAPLPPGDYPLDPSRLFVWLTQADRRFIQNRAACASQAAQVIHSFSAERSLRKPTPRDAAHALSRALSAAQDKRNGGFGDAKSPFLPALCFLQQAALRGDGTAHSILSRTLDAMLSGSLLDPLDGGFFRACLTDDWRGFIPEKPLGVNALLARILLRAGRRTEAVRTFDFLLSAFELPGGGMSPSLSAPMSIYAFTPQQVCAALGSEDGLRVCRLLGLLHRHTRSAPRLTPSRFSPLPAKEGRLSMDEEPLCPRMPASLTPEDAAFLRRAAPALLRLRQARTPQRPAPILLTADCALAAFVLAECGAKLGEPRFTQAAQRAVNRILTLAPAPGGLAGLTPAAFPASPPQAMCGAGASLALALFALAQSEEAFLPSAVRILSATLHAFTRKDGLPMHTPDLPSAVFPRVPAVYDSELPSPAALLVHALRLAHALLPGRGYDEAIDAIWHAAAPAAFAQPLSCAGLIDAVNQA